MPHSRPKASEMAAQVKRGFNEWIAKYMPDTPVHSYLHPDSSAIRVPHESRNRQHRCRVTVCDRDLVETAVSWYEANKNDPRWTHSAKPIPIVNMANEKRPGGDWESGLIAPEECLARRSNLVKNLETPWYPLPNSNGYYPIPQRGGLYSPSIGKISFKWYGRWAAADKTKSFSETVLSNIKCGKISKCYQSFQSLLSVDQNWMSPDKGIPFNKNRT